MRFCTTTFLFFVFSLFSYAQTITTSVLKPPAEFKCGDVPVKLNNIVFGAVPPNSDNNPVVVYIHGWFDNGYAWFMAKNKWYEETYNAGYKSAFFFQSFSDAFEDNGKVVAAMIRETCKHFNTNKIIAVCHSKGGFDIEWALYNENVWDSVQGVVTLSTPFWGAPIADLIKTPIIRSVLENIPIVAPIFRGKGTYQMQTAYMAGVVRPMMDNHPNNRPEKFRCFAGWGYDHRTILPNAMPDDILNVVFYNYRPLCVDIPGLGQFAGDLMSGFMNITATLSKLVQVQDNYNNPTKNQNYIDGLAPYYSSIRPGAYTFSEPPPSTQSYLNHIDVLLSSYTWNLVKPEIDYFKNNPVLRKNTKSTSNLPTSSVSEDIVSAFQLIQTDELVLNYTDKCRLLLTGEYKNEAIQVYDTKNNFVKTIPLNISTTTLVDVFHELDLSFLENEHSYTLKSSVPLTALMLDGNSASIQLNIAADKKYYKNEPLGFEVKLSDWNSGEENVKVNGTLSRNMDVSGNVIWENNIPIRFSFDEQTQRFICSDKLDIPAGIYNITVFADDDQMKRFVTSSILMQQERKKLSPDNIAFSVFPNPSNNSFSVQFDAMENTSYVISITDVLGRKITEKYISSSSGVQQQTYSIAELRLIKGVYVVALCAGDKMIASKNIVVN